MQENGMHKTTEGEGRANQLLPAGPGFWRALVSGYRAVFRAVIGAATGRPEDWTQRVRRRCSK